MLVSLLTPEPTRRVRFDYSARYSAPETSGCYVLTTFKGAILYIGQSNNISRRMEQHLEDTTRRTITPLGKVFWFYYKLCDSHGLDNLERGWVNDYKTKEGKLPFFNKVHPPT